MKHVLRKAWSRAPIRRARLRTSDDRADEWRHFHSRLGAHRLFPRRQDDAAQPLLKDPALADAAVIINEFGEVTIDDLMVVQLRTASSSFRRLPLLHCARQSRQYVGGSRQSASNRLIARLARDHVETTGLADPAPVVQSIMAHTAGRDIGHDRRHHAARMPN
ncbi:GTP-binding protein [Mesorhizobium sp. BHbsci]